jgi:hypothetical protein
VLLSENFANELLDHTRAPQPLELLKASVSLLTIGGAVCNADNGEKTSISKSLRNAKYFAILEAFWKPETGF